jgi:hypothetical protein
VGFASGIRRQQAALDAVQLHTEGGRVGKADWLAYASQGAMSPCAGLGRAYFNSRRAPTAPTEYAMFRIRNLDMSGLPEQSTPDQLFMAPAPDAQ